MPRRCVLGGTRCPPAATRAAFFFSMAFVRFTSSDSASSISAFHRRRHSIVVSVFSLHDVWYSMYTREKRSNVGKSTLTRTSRIASH